MIVLMLPPGGTRTSMLIAACRGLGRSVFTCLALGLHTDIARVPARRPAMARWREKLFAWMVQNSESAMEFFKLPTNRVIELGSQVEI